jgi:aminoglycoside phosphotransferase (APT) family kinase protein
MELIRDAVDRISLAWGYEVVVTAVLIEHHERAIFETRSPEGPVVVKVDTSKARYRREESVLRAAGRAGLPVPAIVLSEGGRPSILVLQRIDGTPLHQGVNDEAWRDAGRVLRRLHGLAWPAEAGSASWSGRSWQDHFRWWADHERDQLLTYDSLPTPAIHRMHRYLSETFADMGEPELRLLHGDCQADHYLVMAGSSRIGGVLDFGDALLGDPVWDLAILTLDEPDMLGEILRGYHPDASTERRTRALLSAYQLIRRLGSASWMREHGQSPEPDLEAARRMVVRRGWTA